MKHLGDISKVNGGEIEPVDIITFGSPCQDLSVAGKRAGLKHEANGDEETTRSGLFMEAVRIIKEMREATNGEYPTFALWENVPGAFSSNNGEDFRIVCEELIKIIETTASMPPVPKNGWNYADSYVGDGWSLAYRVFDAQYWGVPQRRRRIYLVADFRGERAREVLFEREGLRGYFATGRTPWQTTPADAQGGTVADDREGETAGGRQLDAVGVINAIGGNAENSQETDTFPTLTNGSAPGFHNAVAVPYTLKIRGGVDVDSAGKAAGKGALIQTDLSATLGTSQDQYLFQPITDTHIIDNVGGQAEYAKASAVNGTLRAGAQGLVAYSFDSLASNSMKSSNPHSGCRKVEVAKTLDTTDPNPSKNQGGIAVVEPMAYAIENHPADSRVNIDESGKVQTLTSRMGTGGGNVPMVMEPFCKSARGKFKGDAESWVDGKVANTLITFDTGEARANELVVQSDPVICLQGNGIDRADTAGCNGKGWNDETCYTLNTIDRPAVAYGRDRASFNQGQNAQFDFSITEEQQPTLTARGPGAVVHASKASFFMRATDGAADTLVATDYKDPQLVAYSKAANYIVRRLTPTECARLQGFADWWGYLEAIDTFGQKDYQFWCEVYLTKQIIDGKVEYDENGELRYTSTKKPYEHKTVKQMLTWYNKLWTDSSEYKMWGNGIALPTALYCVQGVLDALRAPRKDGYTTEVTIVDETDDWMN